MGEALIRGLLQARVAESGQVLAGDISEERRLFLNQRYGVRSVPTNREVVTACPVVVLAVKPQVAAQVLAEVEKDFSPGQMLVSIVAGWRLRRLENYLPPGTATVRAMPNTPCLVGKGITALSWGPGTSEAQRDVVRNLFSAVGDVVELPEDQLDAVTALSGCGPAYVYLMIEALADAGVRMGLPRPTALRLVSQTFRGSSAMVYEAAAHPAQLKDMVTSPAGATIEGLAVMEEAGLRGILGKAVVAAWRRAQELGKGEG